MFDPFTTGDPLALRLELFEHQGVGATEVLGLASPLAEDAAVWEQLRAMGDAWRAARPDAVLFNHLYVVADQVTYDALAGSEFLRGDFAVFEERSSSRADTSYHGLYFYGRRTYFEFLRPDAAGGFAAGSSTAVATSCRAASDSS
jgi:hypothetical protein